MHISEVCNGCLLTVEKLGVTVRRPVITKDSKVAQFKKPIEEDFASKWSISIALVKNLIHIANSTMQWRTVVRVSVTYSFTNNLANGRTGV
jgi:hypothetical protein